MSVYEPRTSQEERFSDIKLPQMYIDCLKLMKLMNDYLI